jgi:hypothetical protein
VFPVKANPLPLQIEESDVRAMAFPTMNLGYSAPRLAYKHLTVLINI